MAIIYRDTGNDSIESLKDIIDSIHDSFKTITEEWTKVRKSHSLSALAALGINNALIDELDSIADLYTCSTDDCRRLAAENADFCIECCEK